MYKLYNMKLPPIFSMFERTSNIHGYTTRNPESFYIHFVPTSRSQNTIKITGPKLWNMIIKNVNINLKISSYKSYLKKYTLSNIL